MPSERIQRQIDAALDEAEKALATRDWAIVLERAEFALTLDPGNADAIGLSAAAVRGLGSAPAPSEAPAVPSSATTVEHPSSFVAGRYAVRRFLGEGGKKRVYLAHDERLDRDVAFALIKTDGLDDVGRERIVREAQAMGRMGAHPHIVGIYEIGEESGAPYVVTELLGGGDVEGALAAEGGPLPLTRTLEIAKGVARGLAFAHQQGVVHRDLKPGNVWLTSSGPDGVAKIGDFGLAVALDRSRLTTHGLMVGTVAYMPPEQALGGEVTPQADLYSLGAMLYELVTGKPPFAGDSPTAIISQHINTPPVAPSWHSEHCPPDLEALILRLLAKVPADRPGSALEVLEALERVDPEARSASHSDSSANPLDRLARGVFVGRERELERLRSAFDEAFAGRGSVVMLVGEPGIGKTRTVQELSTYARMRGAKVLWGRAHEASGAPPYWPWTQVARAYRDQTPDEVRRRQYEPYAVDLQRIFPNLGALFPNLPEPPPVDSEEAQFQLFDALSSFFRAVSVDTPLVIVLDDLHWADRSTLRMLTHLAREVGMSRLLVTGTYRDTDLDRAHPLSQALAELNREDLFTRILLRGLTEPETAAYIRDTAQAEPAAELVRRVHAETEGNPFFLSEVVRLMAEEGAFSPGAASEIRIPEGVKEALGRRLDRLSPEANELLSVAAVVGRECTHALLAALTDFDDDTLLGLIEEALRARVLEETGVPGEYRFTHALMQDALYSELSTARRVRMHGRVAETLEVVHASELEREAAQLARHFGEASVMNRSLAEKAVQYAELAAQQAEAAAAWDDAARWYREALAGIQDNPAREADLWVSVSLCERHLQNLAGGSSDAFMRGVDAYRRARSPRDFAAGVLRGLSAVAMGSDRAPYRGVVAEALAALGDDESPEAAHLLALAAVSDRSSNGERQAERARVMAEALGLTGARWPWLLEERERFKLSDAGEYERAAQLGLALHERLVALGGEVSAVAAAAPLTGACMALLYEGRIEAAEASIPRLASFAQERRLPSVRAIARTLMARISLARGERQRFSLYASEGPPEHRITRLQVEDALARDEAAIARGLLSTVEEASLEVEPGLALALKMRVLLASGPAEDARPFFAEWRAVADPAGLPSFTGGLLLSIYASAVDAVLEFGDDLLLQSVYTLLDEHPRYRNGPFQGENPDVVRGLLALRLGDPEAAERHYLEGLEWARRPDVRFGLVEGRCLQGLADVAEARGDHSLAMQHLDGAATKFAEYGAKLYLDQVLAKKGILGA